MKYVQYRLNGRHDGGDDEHGGERDHHTISEVVHREVEGEIANANQYKSLKLSNGFLVEICPSTLI